MSKPVKKPEMDDNLYNYMISISGAVHPQIAALLEETYNNSVTTKISTMCSPIDSAIFLNMIAKLVNAKKVVEIGTFTGLTALAFALALPGDGRVLTLDVEETFVNIGKPFWKKAEVDGKIDSIIAPALDSLKLLAKEHAGTVDIVFIDADKNNYLSYYEEAIGLLRSGGIVLIDNVFWHGRVLDENDQSEATLSIRGINQRVHEDSRVDVCVLPISDGVTIARKK